MPLDCPATLEKNTGDRIHFSTASDMRISGIDAFKTTNNETVKAIASLEWITGHTWGARTEAKTGPSESASSFTLLSVRPDEFANVSEFRSDFADKPLLELMNQITKYVRSESLPIPANVAELEAVVKLKRSSKGRIDIWARLIDAHWHHTHDTHGPMRMVVNRRDVWHRVTGDVKPEIPRPVSLLSR